MRLSVLLMTYNHAPFIEQALRSVLDQRTDFPYEVLVAEDCSTDDTPRIVSRLEAENRDRIRVLRRGQNLGMQANFIDAYAQCRGEYVATLDGDDYWTAPDKLQRQVDFLDRYPRFTFCFHNVRTVSDVAGEDGKEIGAVYEGRADRTEFELEDLVKDNFVPFGSVVARAGLIPEFSSWIRDIPGIDWIVGMLNARRGPFARVDGCLGVYRKHAGGAWTSLTWARQMNAVLKIYEGIRGELPSRLWPFVDTMILNIKLRSEWQLAREKVGELMRSQYGEDYQRLVSRNAELEEYCRDIQAKYVNLEQYSRDLIDKYVQLENYVRDRDQYTRDLVDKFTRLEDYNRDRDQYTRDLVDKFTRLEDYARDVQARFAAVDPNFHTRDAATLDAGAARPSTGRPGPPSENGVGGDPVLTLCPDSRHENQLTDGRRAMRYRTQWMWDEFASEPGADLAIFDHDEGFAFSRSPFRRVEYTSYLRRYPRSAVFAYSCGPGGDPTRTDRPAARPELAPDVADRVHPLPHVGLRPGRHALAYCVFLSNAARFVDRFEAADVPFCFTLYPGGGFQLNDDRSDRDLRRVCSSSLFRNVIVTQSVTRRYLIDHELCRPDRITFSFGGVFPLAELEASLPPRRSYPAEKSSFDVGFVAFKYSPKGTEKGYDVFVEVARRLAATVPHARFHVVGNFTPNDIPTGDLQDRMTFHGPRPTSFFPAFYASLDVILAPNTPSHHIPGSFDGFPTGCCIEAGACGVVVVCTDPLGLNGPFCSGEDVVIVPRDVRVICDAVAELANNPTRHKILSENGRRTFHRVFAEDVQLQPRHDLMDRLLGRAPARAAA